MTILPSQVDIRSDIFKRNAEAMCGLVEDLRRRTAGPSESVSRSRIRILPAVGRSRVAQRRSSVVLPAPLGPKRATAAPRSADQVTSSRASVLPKRLLRCSTSSAAGMRAPLPKGPAKGKAWTA